MGKLNDEVDFWSEEWKGTDSEVKANKSLRFMCREDTEREERVRELYQGSRRVEGGGV